MKRQPFFAPGTLQGYRKPRRWLRLPTLALLAGLLAALGLVLFSDVLAVQLAIWGQGL